jgi:proline iminopeptidase
MKTFVSRCAIALMVLALASLARAQEGSTRAEFECLTLANSSRLASAGAPSGSNSFHHVWTPGVDYGTFESNGLKLTYETQGSGNEFVIVVHGGAGLPHEYFHPMLYNLSRYTSLVFFDRRADMLSATSGRGMAPITEMSDDIDALRKKLGLERVTLLGHSFGATIALNYALRYPSNVKRLILVSAGAYVENPYEGEKRILSKLSKEETAAYRSSEGGTGATNPCERVRKRYAVLYPHYFRHLIPYEFDRGVYTAYFDALSKKEALASDAKGLDVRAQLSEIKAPTLVVTGRHDLVTPPDQSAELASGLPLSKLVVLDHSGHFPFFEENYLFTEWVRHFLTVTTRLSDDRIIRSMAESSGSR